MTSRRVCAIRKCPRDPAHGVCSSALPPTFGSGPSPAGWALPCSGDRPPRLGLTQSVGGRVARCLIGTSAHRPQDPERGLKQRSVRASPNQAPARPPIAALWHAGWLILAWRVTGAQGRPKHAQDPEPTRVASCQALRAGRTQSMLWPALRAKCLLARPAPGAGEPWAVGCRCWQVYSGVTRL